MYPEKLRLLMPRCDADKWAPLLSQAMDRYALDKTTWRTCCFLATIAHESAECLKLVENLNYSADALLRVFPRYFTAEQAADYARKPARIASRVYASRNGNGDEESGDGWQYRGRGLLQITGRGNYLECGNAMGLDLVSVPSLLETPEYAAESAAWWFDRHRCIEQADTRNFRGVSGIVNCGRPDVPETRINGWGDRLAYYTHALEIFGALS
jgi:putative chitinase